MSLRFNFGALVAIALALQVGCCCFEPMPAPMIEPPWPCGKTYYGTQCGCKYWHEWFSHKPKCCQSCNSCGHYVGSSNPYVESGPPYTPYGPLYSDGTGANQPGAIGELYPTPASGAPEPGVLEDAAPMDDAAPMSPMDDYLPGPTTSRPRGATQNMAARYSPVDSPRGSRTLGKSPRAKLFPR